MSDNYVIRATFKTDANLERVKELTGERSTSAIFRLALAFYLAALEGKQQQGKEE